MPFVRRRVTRPAPTIPVRASAPTVAPPDIRSVVRPVIQTGMCTARDTTVPAGSTIVSNSGVYVCYTTGLSYAAGYYCPSGQTISGTSCYPTGDLHSGTYYCPTGKSHQRYVLLSDRRLLQRDKLLSVRTNASPVRPAIRPATCTAGQTTVLPDKRISGTYCYPTASPANVYGAGYYCPTRRCRAHQRGEVLPYARLHL